MANQIAKFKKYTDLLDEVYKNGVFYPFGEVFHPSTDAVTDLTGGYYLVWDENYLYCYAVVNESTKAV